VVKQGPKGWRRRRLESLIPPGNSSKWSGLQAASALEPLEELPHFGRRRAKGTAPAAFRLSTASGGTDYHVCQPSRSAEYAYWLFLDPFCLGNYHGTGLPLTLGNGLRRWDVAGLWSMYLADPFGNVVTGQTPIGAAFPFFLPD